MVTGYCIWPELGSLTHPASQVVHSFIQDISIAPLQVHYYSEAFPTTTTDNVSEFHAEAPRATVSEGHAQGPYVVAKARFEPKVPRSTAIDSTNEPPRSHT